MGAVKKIEPIWDGWRWIYPVFPQKELPLRFIKRGYVRNVLAVDSKGKACNPLLRSARRWSLAGALLRGFGYTEPTAIDPQFRNYVHEVFSELGKRFYEAWMRERDRLEPLGVFGEFEFIILAGAHLERREALEVMERATVRWQRLYPKGFVKDLYMMLRDGGDGDE